LDFAGLAPANMIAASATAHAPTAIILTSCISTSLQFPRRVARRDNQINMPTPTVASIREGGPAPDISLLTDTGEPFRLSALRGKTVVLYFYPKADTPGCTTEACEFRDSEQRFDAAGAVIVGVSPCPVEKQAEFKAKYELPFTLLSDTGKTAAQAYGVWREKNMYGKKSMGIVRSTFLIGPDGNIRKIFANVRAAGHAAQVMEALA
jgi:peroxiredoxin Q/BCP